MRNREESMRSAIKNMQTGNKGVVCVRDIEMA